MTTRQHISVATFNIQGCPCGSDRRAVNACRIIANNEVDVVCLQEIFSERTARVIASELGDDYTVFWKPYYDFQFSYMCYLPSLVSMLSGYYAIAFLLFPVSILFLTWVLCGIFFSSTRFNFTGLCVVVRQRSFPNARVVYHHAFNQKERGYLWSDPTFFFSETCLRPGFMCVQLNEDIRLCNVHLVTGNNNPRRRVQILRALNTLINPPTPDAYVEKYDTNRNQAYVFAGDFNAPIDAVEMRACKTLQDASKNVGETYRDSGQQIDFIFTLCMEHDGAPMLIDGVRISDHNGILVPKLSYQTKRPKLV